MVWTCDEVKRKRWLGTIENDMRTVGMCIEDVENREKKRGRIKH